MKQRKCICCRRNTGAKTGLSRYCSRCRAIVKFFQTRAKRLMIQARLPHPERFWCVDCHNKQAKQYDHRRYLEPLKVDPVCVTCNNKRGQAKDVRRIVRAWLS